MRSWQTEDGLPQNSINAILEARDGFLWVGTSGGLARFDGVRFRTFGLQDGLRAVRISALAEDPRGGLWIGTTGGGVSRWENGHITPFAGEHEFPVGSDVVSMAAERDGTLWVGTQSGLLKWKDGKFSVLSEAEGLPQKQIRALAVDAQGTLWVSVIEDGIYQRTEGRFTRTGDKEPASAYSLLADRDGSVWAGGGNGWLWHWSKGVWERLDAKQGLPFSSFEGLAQGDDGTIWVCTRSHGLYRSREGQFVPATNPGELSHPYVRVAVVDHEGSVWAGTISGGLNRLSSRFLSLHGAPGGAEPLSVISVAEDASGAWWLAPAGGGIRRFENGRFTEVDDPQVSGRRPLCYAITTAPDGTVWAAGEQVLFRFHAGEPTKTFTDRPVGGEAIRALCADGDALWMGTYHSTLLKADASGVHVAAPQGSFRGDITSIVCEAPNILWIGSAGGLHHWANGQIHSWDTLDGLLTASIRALFRDPDGTLWLGTAGGGLARFKEGRFFHITTRQGLIDDIVSEVIADDLGFLWLGCNRGIMRIARQEIDALVAGKIDEVHPMIFQRNEGLLKEQCAGGHSPTALKTKDGRLLFPTVAGIAEIDPRRLQDLTKLTPKATIEELLVDGRSAPWDLPLVISPGKHRLEISYTAPVLRGGEWTHFRYRMKGLDADWVMAGTDRVAKYEELRPGKYDFQVQAGDGQGRWIEPGAGIAFTQEPFVWQTLWFGIGVAVLVFCVGGGAAWWHTHRKHRRHVEEMERTRQLEVELAHVSRVSLIGELSASFAHELNQPLAAILSNAQAGLRFLENDPNDLGEVRAILHDISAADRRASEIIGRMRAMMKKEKIQMELGDINVNVTEVLLLLRGDLAKRCVDVSTQLIEEVPLVKGDHIQLQQVILNLLLNGCDAMGSNTPETRQLRVTTARDGANYVRVSVADQGTGIPPEMLHRIFDAFYTTKDNGLGMGLAICHEIIRAHGGKLWATNNSESGATFHFTLPLAEVLSPPRS